MKARRRSRARSAMGAVIVAGAALVLALVLLGRTAPPSSPSPVAAIGSRAEQADGSAAYAIAQRIGCVDYEPQSHLPGIQSQGTCRIGDTRIYVQTFAKSATRSRYQQGGAVGRVTGSDIAGRTWVVHVDQPSAVAHVRGKLAGMPS
ncbi:MAG: hypothetical protein ACTHMH_01245 [Curtobacterium sp.]